MQKQYNLFARSQDKMGIALDFSKGRLKWLQQEESSLFLQRPGGIAM